MYKYFMKTYVLHRCRYFMKDMWMVNDVMFFLHHVVGLIGCVAVLLVPSGVGYFIVGTMVLELGTLTFNVVLLGKAVQVDPTSV